MPRFGSTEANCGQLDARDAASRLDTRGIRDRSEPYEGGEEGEEETAFDYESASGRTKVLAIGALILACVLPIVGRVLTDVALSQLQRSGRGGRCSVLAGVIIVWTVSAIAIPRVMAVVAPRYLLRSPRLGTPGCWDRTA